MNNEETTTGEIKSESLPDIKLFPYRKPAMKKRKLSKIVKHNPI